MSSSEDSDMYSEGSEGDSGLDFGGDPAVQAQLMMMMMMNPDMDPSMDHKVNVLQHENKQLKLQNRELNDTLATVISANKDLIKKVRLLERKVNDHER